MADPQVRKRMAELLRLFREHRLEELLIEDRDLKLHLRARPAGHRPGHTPAPSPPAPALKTPEETGPRQRTVAIRSPLIGVFYRAPAPDAPPFVEIGDHVEEGQTVCIVEAMKVFNEIKAEWSGRVVAIPAKDGQLVQAGDPLVVLAFGEE